MLYDHHNFPFRFDVWFQLTRNDNDNILDEHGNIWPSYPIDKSYKWFKTYFSFSDVAEWSDINGPYYTV
jgi:hypothetical protein